LKVHNLKERILTEFKEHILTQLPLYYKKNGRPLQAAHWLDSKQKSWGSLDHYYIVPSTLLQSTIPYWSYYAIVPSQTNQNEGAEEPAESELATHNSGS
jgi:hypothetical protein